MPWQSCTAALRSNSKNCFKLHEICAVRKEIYEHEIMKRTCWLDGVFEWISNELNEIDQFMDELKSFVEDTYFEFITTSSSPEIKP